MNPSSIKVACSNCNLRELCMPVGLTDEFATDSSRQAMWHAFLKKNEITITPLSEVVTKLGQYWYRRLFKQQHSLMRAAW